MKHLEGDLEAKSPAEMASNRDIYLIYHDATMKSQLK